MIYKGILVCVHVQVQLQNILMSKHVEYFLVEVSGWQRRLMLADLVIGTWLGVQRTWAHLQSIFTNSEDIRNQLAHDAELFQGIHRNFQVAAQERSISHRCMCCPATFIVLAPCVRVCVCTGVNDESCGICKCD